MRSNESGVAEVSFAGGCSADCGTRYSWMSAAQAEVLIGGSMDVAIDYSSSARQRRQGPHNIDHITPLRAARSDEEMKRTRTATVNSSKSADAPARA